MTVYQCYRCGYESHIKTILVRHINRKNICKPKINNIKFEDCKEYILNGMSYKEYCCKINVKKNTQNIPINTHFGQKISPKYPQNDLILDTKLTDKTQCEYCDKILSSYKNLRRHLKTCKEKKKDDTVKESMEELVKLLNDKEKQLEKKDTEYKKQLKEELDKRDKQIEELIKKAGLSTTNNNTNNITNNIQNNIKLLNYKETDTSHLTENDYVKCLEHYNFCVPHLIRKIHFNPKKPENHNIYISNLKNSYVMIYINNKWKVKNRDETILRMIDDKQVILEKKIQEWVESGIQYPKVMAKFSRYIEKREEDDVINAIKEDIKLMLYNNRNMIIENNKRISQNNKKLIA